MGDTRTIYLHTGIETFSSDPSDSQYMYLDMSDYDSLNPQYQSTIKLSSGVAGIYESTKAKITLTFKGENSGRDARADWVNKYAERINKISVNTTENKSAVFNKSAVVSEVEFIDTPYIDGSQVIIEVTMFGRWQSALTVLETVSEKYEGGDKVYYSEYQEVSESKTSIVGYAYVGLAEIGDSSTPDTQLYQSNTYSYNYTYGNTTLQNQIALPKDRNRFMLAIDSQYSVATITLSANGKRATISTSRLSANSSLSSDFVAYDITAFVDTDTFLLLNSGLVASVVWDNLASQYAVLYQIMNSVGDTPADISVTTTGGQHIPFKLYTYSVQDFI